MSIYPTPTNTNIFNEKDFNNNDKNENNDNDIIDLSNYVKKTGDTMNGKLLIPELEFYDSSIQNTAFDNTIKQNINNNTTKLSGINFINGYSEITKIKTNEIEINGINCDAFSNLDKLKIYENEGNILNHNNRITSNEINIATNALNIQTNITNIQTNTNKILTLENSIDDNGEQNITHSSNIGINGTHINTLSKSLHNDSIHIYNCTVKCNDLLNSLKYMKTDIETNIKVDIETNKNEIQQTKTDIINANNEINDNNIKLSHIQTTWDRYTITSFEDRDIFLNPGEASISLYSNEVRFGNEQDNSYFILNGNRQHKAYTNQIHDYYMLKIQELSERVNWLVHEHNKRLKLENGIADNDPNWISEYEPVDYGL